MPDEKDDSAPEPATCQNSKKRNALADDGNNSSDNSTQSAPTITCICRGWARKGGISPPSDWKKGDDNNVNNNTAATVSNLKKTHFILLGAKRRDEDFLESTPSSPFFLCDAREQLNEIDGIPSCFSFFKDGNVVQREDEKSISAVNCLTDNRLVLVINFSALREENNRRRDIISRNKDSGSYGEEALKAANATVNILDLLSKMGGALDNVGKNYHLGEQAASVIKEVARVMSCAPYVGIAFAAIVPVLTVICNSYKVAEKTIDLFERLETLLTYLNDVVVYVVVKGGSDPQGDKTFCMIMTLIDQSFEEIMKIHKERVNRLWRSNGHLEKLSDLDDKITKMMIETTALNSMKDLRGISVDVENVNEQLSSLNEKLKDYVQNGEATEKEIQAVKNQMSTLGDLVQKSIRISEKNSRVLAQLVNMLEKFFSMLEKFIEKMYTEPNYPNQNKITTEDQISEHVRPQLDQSIQEGVQIDLVLQAAVFLNMIFLTLAYEFLEIEDENQRYSFCRGMTGNELSDYLKQEQAVLRLDFRPRQATLFAASCNFVESLGDDVILYDIDRSEDCTFGVFINKAAKRITIVFRPMITAVTKKELKISTLGIFHLEEIDLSRLRRDLKKDKNIGKVCLQRGYYNFALSKYDQIKVMLYKLNGDDSEYKDFSLYVSGHSFGAAIANIVSFLIVRDGYNNDKMLTLSTFGSPRVGNIGWRDLNRVLGEKRQLLHLRVSRDMDIIPSLPSKCLGFYHTGKEPFRICCHHK